MRRWRTLKNGYRIDRRLMLIFYLPIFLLGAGAITWSLINGFNGVACYEPQGCLNPYYNRCDDYKLCGEEVLYPGYEYNKPPLIFTDYMVLPMVVLGVAYFLLNHRLNNRGWKFDL